MGVIERAREAWRVLNGKRTLTVGQQAWHDVLAGMALPGDPIAGRPSIRTSEEAFRNVGVVHSAVQTIVRSAAVPLLVVDDAGNPAENLNARVRDWLRQPLPGMPYLTWISRVIGQLVLTGGSRLLALSAESPEALLPVPVSECTVQSGNVYPAQTYVYRGQTYPRERVVEVLMPDPCQLFDAVAPVEAASRSWRSTFHAEQHVLSTLGNGAFIPSAIVHKAGFASIEQFHEFRNKLAQQLEGASRSGRFLLLDNDASIEKLGYSLVDLALPVILGMSKNDVITTLGITPALMGVEVNSYAEFTQQLRVFVGKTLEPTWLLIESAFNAQLAQRLGVAGFRFDRSSSWLVRELHISDAQTFGTLVANGTMLVNEARRMLGLPEVDYGWSWHGPVLSSEFQSGLEPKPDRAATSRTELATALASFLRGRTSRLGAEVRRAYWRTFDAVLGDYRSENGEGRGFIGRYAREMAKLLRALRLALLDSAAAHWEKDMTVPYDRAEFDREAMQRRMRLLPAIWREGARLGESTIDDLTGRARTGRGKRYELAEAAMELIRSRAEHWTELTGDLTFDAIDELLGRAVAEGYSLAQLQSALNDEAMLSPMRAERIARTEVLGALNEGTVDSYRQSGIVERKEWLSVQDDRTRDAHAEADGQMVELEAPFNVDGEALQFPGDPAGDPGNIINCRCTVLPVIETEVQSD